MQHNAFRPTALAAALMALGLAAGVSAQTTDQGTTGGSHTTMPSPSAGAKSPSSPSPAGSLDRTDRKFLERAANGGMMEVQLGEMAQQKASSDQVRQFAQRMVEDHSKANDELKQIANAKGAAVPAAVDRSVRKDLQNLEKLSGADFDRAYMKNMVDDHKQDVSAFQKQAKSGKDADLKEFAAKALPTLQEHQKLAQATYDAVRNTKSSGATKSGTSRSPSSGTAPSGTGSSPMPGTPPSSTTK